MELLFPLYVLIRWQVVLADSTIVQANAEENSDLFRALKGGGPNFGENSLGLRNHPNRSSFFLK